MKTETGRRTRGTELTEVARGSTMALAGAAVAALTTIAVTLLVTREFTKPVAGAFFAAISLFIIVSSVASLGASSGVVYFVARLRAQDSQQRIPAMLRAAFRPAACAALMAALLLAVFAGPLATALLGGHTEPGVSTANVALALRTMAVALPFAALLDTFLSVSRGYRDMRPTVVVDRLGRSSGQLLGVLVAVLAGSAALLAPLWAAAYVPATVIAWLWLRHSRREWARQLPAPAVSADLSTQPRRLARRIAEKQDAAAARREFWRFTAPRSLATLAQVIIQRLDIVLVGILKGPAEAALYTAATRFVVIGQFGNAAISLAAQPRFTEFFSLGDRRTANRVYQATTGWLVLLNWPMYLLAVLYGPQILAVFGHSYRAGTEVMVILALAMLVATACGQVDMVLTTTGRSSWSLANGIAAVVVNVSVDLALIPKYGITGAAIGWAAAIAVTNLVPLAQIARTVRLQPFGPGTLTACGISALCFYALPLAARAGLGGQAAVSVAAVGVGCVLYVTALWLLREVLQLPAIPVPGFARRST
jgi:O-antigen/teichoic acid export membrane protein